MKAPAQKQLNILDAYSPDFPTHQIAFDLFKGEWSSAVPGYETGHIGLFSDQRVDWFAESCGGFEGKKILELGPLEAGHTFMLARSGAASVLSIESNQRAYLKCLIVQQALKFPADFMLGDFQPFLATTSETFDFVLCSGVLYHLTDPIGFLTNIGRVAKSVGIWTHYYDRDVIEGTDYLKPKFAPTSKPLKTAHRTLQLFEQSYLQALDWNGFCGGPKITSYWLTKHDILAHLQDQGFAVKIGDDDTAHPHGPCMLIYAEKS